MIVTTNLSQPLSKLIDLGLIEKESIYGADERNSKKTLYKISDQFLAFYYRFVVPNISFINLDRRKPIELQLQSGLNEFISLFWEKICREAITGNDFEGRIYGKASRWWGSVKTVDGIKQMEIDIVADSLDDKSILVGECKWTNPEIASVLTKHLKEKISYLPFCKGKEVIPVLFLKNKPKDINEIRDNIRILYPNDIIELMKK